MAIISEAVIYSAFGRTMLGRFFHDDTVRARRAGVLVFPEGFGISEHTYETARRLADLGYVALACDLYGEALYIKGGGGEIAVLCSQIRATTGGLFEIGKSAYEVLCARADVDASRIAAIGYCFGSDIACELAFSGLPIAAIAGFHPSFKAITLANAANTRGCIHIFVGSEDSHGPLDRRVAFEEALAGKRLRWRMTVYGGVKHCFTNPEADGPTLAYDPIAARDSWRSTVEMFEEALADGHKSIAVG
jgi:dienelactone hydrolase